MLIKVKIFPCCKKEEVLKKKEDAFDVKVKEKPLRGMANRALISLLSSYFNIPPNKIRIIKGFRKRNKIIEIIK
jgi:hypothetical protein